jgi:hypothetical protein
VDNLGVEMPEISLTALFLLCAAVFGVGFSLGWLARLSGLTIQRRERKSEDTEPKDKPE